MPQLTCAYEQVCEIGRSASSGRCSWKADINPASKAIVTGRKASAAVYCDDGGSVSKWSPAYPHHTVRSYHSAHSYYSAHSHYTANSYHTVSSYHTANSYHNTHSYFYSAYSYRTAHSYFYAAGCAFSLRTACAVLGWYSLSLLRGSSAAVSPQHLVRVPAVIQHRESAFRHTARNARAQINDNRAWFEECAFQYVCARQKCTSKRKNAQAKERVLERVHVQRNKEVRVTERPRE